MRFIWRSSCGFLVLLRWLLLIGVLIFRMFGIVIGLIALYTGEIDWTGLVVLYTIEPVDGYEAS